MKIVRLVVLIKYVVLLNRLGSEISGPMSLGLFLRLDTGMPSNLLNTQHMTDITVT